MKINKITVHEVMVPTHPEAIESKGMNKPLHKAAVGASEAWSIQFDELSKLMLKMELDDGIIGWGELYRAHDWRVVDRIAQSLIGKDINTFTLQSLPFNFTREYDGFECAIWDAYAKAHGLRVVDLLGGPVKEMVKVGAWSGHRRVEDVGDLAIKYFEQGYDCIKFKCDLEDDVVSLCRGIQQAVPSMSVILDPNERWENSGESRIRIRELQEIGNLLCLEDPIPRWKLNEFSRLRAYGSIPIALHISLPYIQHGQRIDNAIDAIQAEAVDGFNFNCGLADFQRLDHVASAVGLPCWHGSEVDLGILEAMYVHSAAAAKSCVWPSDIFGQMIRSHDLLQEPLTFKPPYVELPKGLGLGVEPDEDAIRHYQINEKTYK
ncbi:MAG: mandelate racemase/muconate lactonizing enzyme family protein [Cyclobacteriaceae bacterium]|nr:mandelate racemase/muconate lactonizing enzyme family protein [Cyclobacteriaceae bacterium]